MQTYKPQPKKYKTQICTNCISYVYSPSGCKSYSQEQGIYPPQDGEDKAAYCLEFSIKPELLEQEYLEIPPCDNCPAYNNEDNAMLDDEGNILWKCEDCPVYPHQKQWEKDTGQVNNSDYESLMKLVDKAPLCEMRVITEDIS